MSQKVLMSFIKYLNYSEGFKAANYTNTNRIEVWWAMLKECLKKECILTFKYRWLDLLNYFRKI